MARKTWTKEENELMMKIYHMYSSRELAEIFDVSIGSINHKKMVLGINNKQLREKDNVPEGMRKCKSCGEIFPLERFVPKYKDLRDNRRSTSCRDCLRLQKSIAWRENKKREME